MARLSFTPAPAAKPFEASIGRILFKLDTGANQAFGNALGKSPAWVSRMKDPGDPTHLRASEVARACQSAGTVEPIDDLFNGVRIGGHEWRMQPVPEVVEADDMRLDAMELAGQAGAFIAAVGRALADGSLDRREAAELDQQLAEVEQQVASLRAAMRAARGAA